MLFLSLQHQKMKQSLWKATFVGFTGVQTCSIHFKTNMFGRKILLEIYYKNTYPQLHGNKSCISAFVSFFKARK